jgi:uncharacterized protein YjbI with pentapeptide repeats
VEPTPQTVEPTPAANAPDAQKLLESANSASEQVGVLHLGFIAACAYVIVIAVGRTDLDLLIGKGIRLPIIDTEVPIVGFFAFAPWILVIVHFNLLLHLQLLARKLHAFDSADAQGELRDQLRIFPITWYLAGKTDSRTQGLLSLMVSITVIILPLLSMLILQLQFLAYQSEIITWFQRMAIWLDLGQLVYFWPIIVEQVGSLSCVNERHTFSLHLFFKRKRERIASFLFTIALFLGLCGTSWYAGTGFIVLWLSAITAAMLELRKPLRYTKIVALAITPLFAIVIITKSRAESASFYYISLSVILIILSIFLSSIRHQLTRRSTFFLSITGAFCLPLSLGLHIDGERLEKFLISLPSTGEQSTLISRLFISDKRILNLQEQRLFANHPEPEVIAQLRSENWAKALQKIEPINLLGRSLRHANLEKALLFRADFRHADLRGAHLSNAQLQGARLAGAQMQSTVLLSAQMQGADLSDAQLQGADLVGAQLQGADLARAQLQGAYLGDAQLQGAYLSLAQLQGAHLHHTQLQGADLSFTQLQGADLGDAQLQCTYLVGAQLQGADLARAQLQGANLGDAQLQGANLALAQLQGAYLGDAQLQGAYLYHTQLQGADLREANLYGATFQETDMHEVDARDLIWSPLTKNDLAEMTDKLKKMIPDKDTLATILGNLQKSSLPNASKPTLQSCLASDDLPISCDKRFDPRNPEELAAFKAQLHPILANLAAESPDIVRGIIRQIPDDPTDPSSRFGLATLLVKRLDAGNAPGLQALSDKEKADLRDKAKKEQKLLKK